MQIAIMGGGRIGSTFAFHLARAGNDVTVVARGKRLAELEAAQAIETVNGDRAPIHPVAALDESKPWDVVIVTVLAHQLEPIMPTLVASQAKTVLFMFNNFDSLEPIRAQMGARCAIGFPNMIAFFEDGKLRGSVKGPGQKTTLDRADLAPIFNAAGMPTEIQPDMQSFLRSHAAMVIPLMVAGNIAYARGAGVTWAEAKQLVRAMREAFGVVTALGNALVPGMVASMNSLPGFLMTFLVWTMSRTATVRDLGVLGPGESRELIDAVVAASPAPVPTLLAIRPT